MSLRLSVTWAMSLVASFSLGAAIFNGVATDSQTHHLWSKLGWCENTQAVSTLPSSKQPSLAPKSLVTP